MEITLFEPIDCCEESYDALMTVLFNLADNGYINRLLLNQFFDLQDLHFHERAEALICKQKVNGIIQDYTRKRRCYLRNRTVSVRVIKNTYGPDTFQEILCMHHPYYYNLWSKLNRTLHVNSWLLGEINEEILTGLKGLTTFQRIYFRLDKKYSRGQVIDVYDQFQWEKTRQKNVGWTVQLTCDEELSDSDEIIEILSIDSSNEANESDSDIDFPPVPFNL